MASSAQASRGRVGAWMPLLLPCPPPSLNQMFERRQNWAIGTKFSSLDGTEDLLWLFDLNNSTNKAPPEADDFWAGW